MLGFVCSYVYVFMTRQGCMLSVQTVVNFSLAAQHMHSTLQVFVHEDLGKLESVKITDFGLARDLMEGCHHITPTTEGTRYCVLHTCCIAP